MAGRNPAEAVGNFLDPLQRALSCVARGKFTLSAGGRGDTDTLHALALNGDGGAVLQGGVKLWVRMQYRIVHTNDLDRGPWKVSTCAYAHALELPDGAAIVSYHWHPSGSSVHYPHVHVGAAQLSREGVLTHKLHMPTGRVALEDVIEFAITDLGVQPLDDGWRERLDETRSAFVKYRTWTS